MNPKHEQSFFAGQAEVIARISGLLVIGLFFTIYTVATNQIILDWSGIVKLIALFWFLYEITSLIFYQLFQYFQHSGSKTFEPILNQKEITNDNQQNNEQHTESSSS